MKLEEIEVTIGPDGKVRIQTSGFSGEECLEATKDLESLLGNQLAERELTAEASDRVRAGTAEKIKIRR